MLSGTEALVQQHAEALARALHEIDHRVADIIDELAALKEQEVPAFRSLLAASAGPMSSSAERPRQTDQLAGHLAGLKNLKTLALDGLGRLVSAGPSVAGKGAILADPLPSARSNGLSTSADHELDEVDSELAFVIDELADLKDTNLADLWALMDQSLTEVAHGLAGGDGTNKVCQGCGEVFQRLRTLKFGNLVVRLCRTCSRGSTALAPAVKKLSSQPKAETKPDLPLRVRVVQREVQRLLQERGAPMDLADIHAALLERGVQLPGQGLRANVSLCIGTMDTHGIFYKPRWGVYGLASWRTAEEG